MPRLLSERGFLYEIIFIFANTSFWALLIPLSLFTTGCLIFFTSIVLDFMING